MTPQKNNTKRNVITAILITLVVLVNLARVAVRFSQPKPQQLNYNLDEVYRITAQQRADDFDKKYGHGDFSRIREESRP